MDARVNKAMEITTPSDLEIVMTRTFDAPRHLVFDAMTQPEHVRHWLGCAEMPMTVCEIDLRVGGTYRFTLRSPEGRETTLQGSYREVLRPERVVFVERSFGPDGVPAGEIRHEFQVG